MEGEPPKEAVAMLRGALEDEEPLVREHAAWPLERIARRGSGGGSAPGGPEAHGWQEA